ncbi:MAG: PT domain-containing protein [Clostridia bacterium]|nr:PT domain-containing protein [Clostridia bacterium]
MKKGKIATLAAFCAVFAALFFTACGDEGKENATPLPTNTAAQTETAKPTENPTEVPTVEPTAVPTTEPTAKPTKKPTAEPTAVPTTEPTEVPESPMPTIETLSDDYNAKDLDYEVLKKMYMTIFPDREDYNYTKFGDWSPYSPKYERRDWITECSFIDVGDCILFIASDYVLSFKDKPFFYIAYFSYEGELIINLWEEYRYIAKKSFDYSVFKHNSKVYLIFNNLRIYEIKRDDVICIWNKDMFLSKCSIDENCYDSYALSFNSQNGVDVYFYDENIQSFKYLRSFTFDELLSGVDITDW